MPPKRKVEPITLKNRNGSAQILQPGSVLAVSTHDSRRPLLDRQNKPIMETVDGRPVPKTEGRDEVMIIFPGAFLVVDGTVEEVLDALDPQDDEAHAASGD
jgi:hypothetical protein